MAAAFHQELGMNPSHQTALSRRRRGYLDVGVTALLILSCSARPRERTLDVTALDYAFRAPDTVAAGPTLVRFHSAGKVRHEMILIQLQHGASAGDLIAAQKRDESFRQYVDGGNAVLFAEPGAGDDARIFVDFAPDRDYVLWCNFTDAEGKPQHAMLGMFKQLHVRGSHGTATAGADSSVHEVIVATNEYAFSMPDTLQAGATNFRIRNDGQVRHEISMDLLKPGVTVQRLLDEDRRGGDIDSLLERSAGVLTARAGERNDMALRLDLLSGRIYMMICEFRDAPDKPPHVALGMFKSIAVR